MKESLSHQERPTTVVPLSQPLLNGNEWAYLSACLESGWVSSAGPFVERFEHDLASAVGAPHAVAVINGTAGLHVALRAVGVEPDDEVLVSNLTFIAPVNAIRYCQAHPILVDADPATWQMDSEKVERFLTQGCEVRGGACINRRTGRRVRAIVPVHILGLACQIDRIVALAHQHHLLVVEDAAEAMGVRYRDRAVGTFGDVGVFSFNGNKIITSGGGGMLVTRNPRYAEAARYLTTQARDDARESIHNSVGYNYRLTSLHAALGVAQLEQLGAFVEKKQAIARAYEAALRNVEGLTLMPNPPHTEPTYWLYTVLLAEGTSLQQRQAVIAQLREAGFEARPLWHPINGLPPYRDCQTVTIEHSFRLYERAVSLPSSVDLEAADLRRCVAALRKCVSAS